MPRMIDFVIGSSIPALSEVNRRLGLYVTAVRWHLAEERVVADWRKLVVALDLVPSPTVASRFPVSGVMQVNLGLEPSLFARLNSTTGIGLTRSVTLEALDVLTRSWTWDDEPFRRVIDKVAEHHGPFVRCPPALMAGRGPTAVRVAMEMDEAGTRLLLIARTPDGFEWRRMVLRDFARQWYLPDDFVPRRIRRTGDTVALLDAMGRVLETVKVPPTEAPGWTTHSSGD